MNSQSGFRKRKINKRKRNTAQTMAPKKDINNRNSLRIENQALIISLLRKSEALSISYIAEELGLSFVATNAIVSELVENGVLIAKKQDAKKAGKGRAPIMVGINEDAGVSASIDLSSSDLTVAIFDLKDRMLCYSSIPNVSFVEEEHFKQLAAMLSSLLSQKEVQGRKLLEISIATPGMINSYTGDYATAYRIKGYSKINPRTYFSNLYNVPTKLYNDVKVSALAERAFNPTAASMQNFLYAHIGSSSGLALFLNGKLFTGTNGYSGEVSIFNPIDEIGKSSRQNKLYSVHRLYESIVKDKGLQPQRGGIEEIKKWQDEKDPIALRRIDESARYNAIALIGYADLLDLEGIIIEGPIVALGEEYRSLLLKYVNLYDAHEVRFRILFSGLQQNGTLLGGAYMANSQYYFSAIKKMTTKRLALDPESVNGSEFDLLQSLLQ